MKDYDWHLIQTLDGRIARANYSIHAVIEILNAINKAESTRTPDGKLLSITKKSLHKKIQKTRRRINEAIDILEMLHERGQRNK